MIAVDRLVRRLVPPLAALAVACSSEGPGGDAVPDGPAAPAAGAPPDGSPTAPPGPVSGGSMSGDPGPTVLGTTAPGPGRTDVAFRTLASAEASGPPLNGNDPDELGLHLRRFAAWTSAAEARAALDGLGRSDGERESVVSVLEREGGTLVGLFLGLQPSYGHDARVTGVVERDGELLIDVRTETAGGCLVEEAFAAPYRIVHVAARAPRTVFREAVVPCTEDDDAYADPAEVGRVDVAFAGDAGAVVSWEPPPGATAGIRYDVVDESAEETVFDGVDEARYVVDDLVPGVVRALRIVPVTAGAGRSPRGRAVALTVDAPTGAFRGRATRADLDARAAALAGEGARDCGESVTGIGPATGTDVVPGCLEASLAAPSAFTRTWTVDGGDGLTTRTLVGDARGRTWLLRLDLSDVDLANRFAPSVPGAGSLTGEPCPAPLVEASTGRVRCTD